MSDEKLTDVSEPAVETRWCVRCGKTKPLTLEFFGKEGGNRSTSNYKRRCRDCSPDWGKVKRKRYIES